MKPETTARKDARTAETLPVFQHRHFAAIAAVFAEDRRAQDLLGYPKYGEDARDWHWHDLVTSVAAMFERSNPRFDRARFLRACGVES
jgi:hypothetical protein